MLIKSKSPHINEALIEKAIQNLPDSRRLLFSSFDDEMIKKYYPIKGGVGIAKVLNKTTNQIHRRAGFLGVRCIGKTNG